MCELSLKDNLFVLTLSCDGYWVLQDEEQNSHEEHSSSQDNSL